MDAIKVENTNRSWKLFVKKPKAVKTVASSQAVETMKNVHPVDAMKNVHPVETVRKLSRVIKFVPNTISKRAGRAAAVASKGSPTILFGVGVVGIVGTTVMACRATLKLDEVLEDHHSNVDKAKMLLSSERADYTIKDYNRDMTLLYVRASVTVVKLYAPSIVLGAVTISALTRSHNLLNRRNASLTAAYAAVEKGFSQYRERVISEFGEDKDREFRYGTRDETIIVESKKNGEIHHTNKVVKRVGPEGASVYARFFDEYSKNWSRTPEYNHIFLTCQQNYANDLLRSRGHVFLNEVYDMLGIDRSKAGAVVGWVLDPECDNFVDFGIFNGDKPGVRDFVNGREGSILLDFNVDGVIYDKI